jgi:hypothetical protein
MGGLHLRESPLRRWVLEEEEIARIPAACCGCAVTEFRPSGL